MMTVVRKALAYWNENGTKRFLKRIGQAVWHNERYIVYHKPVLDTGPSTDHPEVRFQTAGLGRAGWLATQWPRHFAYVGPEVEAVLEARLDAGERCIVGTDRRDHERCVYMAWLAFRDYALLALLAKLDAPAQACVKNIWVARAFRQRGVAWYGQRYLEGLAKSIGCRHLWAFVKPQNDASHALHEKTEYTRYGTITFHERMGRRTARLRQGGGVCPLDLAATRDAVL